MARIVIDPGHGGDRPRGKSSPLGARGAHGTPEHAINYALAQRVQRLLGADAVLTRPANGNRSLGERAAFARERGAGVFLSLHAHGHGGPTETWVHTSGSDRSLRLAHALGTRVAGRLGGARGVRRGNFAVLHPSWHAPETAACMLETDALDADERHLDQLAGTIADGLRSYVDDRRLGRAAETARALDDAGAAEPTVCATWSSEDDYHAACQNIESLFASDSGGGAATAQALGILPAIAGLTPAQITTCRAVYGSSIDYTNVYLTDSSGLGGRPFTIYVPLRAVQVINAGTLTPAPNVLIHEMAHVWQSQHATDPKAFMTNSVASQALASANNLAEGSTAAQYPFSSYAYVPGSPFSDYAAEQIANQVEGAVTVIVSHVAGVASGTIDPDNDTSLATPRIEDRRLPGVVY